VFLHIPSICHLFCFYFQVIVNLHQHIQEVQIYFAFFELSVGKPKTVLKGGYVGRLCKRFDKA
jgi:hypothetical protein